MTLLFDNTDPIPQPNRVMPHTHVPFVNESPETLGDHIVGSHGFSRHSVQVAYDTGRLVSLHTDDHPDGVEYEQR